LIGTVHDSLLYECSSHQFDRLKHHKHHWIEEGTYDDFKKCILTSDLPEVVFGFASTGGFALMGTVTGRIAGIDMAVQAEDRVAMTVMAGVEVALMGTYIVPPADRIGLNLQAAHYVHMDFARIERTVIEMLMNRPEVIHHEPEAKAAVA